MSSIHLVSKAAKVSAATVSRVINCSRQVSPETAEIVRRVMAEVGYVPPPPEKRQRRKSNKPLGVRSGNVLLLFPDAAQTALRTALSGRLMNGVGEVLAARSMNMIVSSLTPAYGLPACVQEGQVDGVIVRGGSAFQPLLHELRHLPCVWLLELAEPAAFGDQVSEDNVAVGFTALASLRERGLTRLAYMNPHGQHPGYRARSHAFQDAAARINLRLDAFVEDAPEARLDETERWQPPLLRLVDRFIASAPRAQGLFVPCNDTLVEFVYRALRERGVHVGDELVLMGCSYDPIRLAALDPDLPQIDIQPEAMGRAAVETLLWRLRHLNEPRRRILIAPTIVETSALR